MTFSDRAAAESLINDELMEILEVKRDRSGSVHSFINAYMLKMTIKFCQWCSFSSLMESFITFKSLPCAAESQPTWNVSQQVHVWNSRMVLQWQRLLQCFEAPLRGPRFRGLHMFSYTRLLAIKNSLTMTDKHIFHRCTHTPCCCCLCSLKGWMPPAFLSLH